MRVRPTTAHPSLVLSVRRSGHVPAGLHPAVLVGPATLESNSRMVLPCRMRKEVGEIWAAQGPHMAWGSAGPSSQAMEFLARKAEELPWLVE